MSEDKKIPSKEEREQEEDFSFIQEKVNKKKKTRGKGKKFLVSLLNTLVLAVVFGVVACLTFLSARPFLMEKLGIKEEEKDSRKQVILVDDTKEPDSSEEPEGAEEPTESEEPAESEEPSENPVTGNADATPGPKKQELTLKDYSKLYLKLSNFATEIERSVVEVTNVKEETDIFENTEVTADSFFGLALADNGEELLLLVPYEKLADFNRLEVRFANGATAEAQVLSFDQELGIAILTVALEMIPEEVFLSLEMAKLGDSYYLSAGTPLLALGSPNGYLYSREIGFVTNPLYDGFIQDGIVELFNTDMDFHDRGEAFLINLNGEVVGFHTRNFADELNEDMYVVLRISKIKKTIEQMVNGEDRASFGIIGRDMTDESLSELSLEDGIYVSEVIPDSAAYKAGIVNGDVLVKIDDEDISSLAGFATLLRNYQVKDTVKIELVRTAKSNQPKMTVEVTLGKK